LIAYVDFSLKIEPKRGEDYPVIVLRSPAGEGRSYFCLPLDPDRLGSVLIDLGRTVRGSSRAHVRGRKPLQPQEIGELLFNALFTGPKEITIRAQTQLARHKARRSLPTTEEREAGEETEVRAGPWPAEPSPLQTAPWARLSVVNSLQLPPGRSWDLTRHEVTIGRAMDNEIIIPDRPVSRYHALLRYQDGDPVLSDQGSHFGTRVNGEPISRLGRHLVDGDELQLGQCTVLRFTRLAPASNEQSPGTSVESQASTHN